MPTVTHNSQSHTACLTCQYCLFTTFVCCGRQLQVLPDQDHYNMVVSRKRNHSSWLEILNSVAEPGISLRTSRRGLHIYYIYIKNDFKYEQCNFPSNEPPNPKLAPPGSDHSYLFLLYYFKSSIGFQVFWLEQR